MAVKWRPLNVPLYQNLRRAFGDVYVMHPGFRNIERGYVSRREFGSAEPRESLEIQWSGETYAVACPFCQSAPEKKLFVNHTYMTQDPKERGRRRPPRYWLAQCFRKYRCLDDPHNRDFFWNLLELPGGVVSINRLRQGKEPDAAQLEPSWPEYCEPVDALPPSHQARLYLIDRGFDPAYLAERFRVHFCIDSMIATAKRRIIIPFYADGKHVGWQGRVPAELPWKDPTLKKGLPPKYTNMPGFRKSLVCYNLDVAKAFKTIVVCEGVTGVWRHGDYATAVQGMSPSIPQLRRLARASGKKGLIVWLLDPGAKEQAKAQTACATLKAGGYPSCVVELPAGFDSGDMDADVQRGAIEIAAKSQGFKVDWGMKETKVAVASA